MKKIIAIVLAIVMMAAMAVPAFAEKVAGDNALKAEHELGGGTVITYGAQQSYIVTIPQSVNFLPEQADEDGLISVTDKIVISEYSLAANKTLTVYIDSDEGATKYQEAHRTETKWYLYETGESLTGANDVEYFVTAAGVTVARGGSIASACTGTSTADVEVALVFSTKGTSQVASFTDTISYTVKIA